MAVVNTKKTVFTLLKVRKAIKNIIKKAFKNVPSKKSIKNSNIIVEAEESENYDTEINDNTHNEALEARLRQMIEASPASLDIEAAPGYTRGALQVNTESRVHLATFWTGEEEGDTWDLYPELCQFNSNMIRKTFRNCSTDSPKTVQQNEAEAPTS